MPLHGERSALEFTGDGRTLRWFWEDLDRLLERAAVAGVEDKMYWATVYASEDDGFLWKDIAKARVTDAGAQRGLTWDEFKSRVSKLYLNADDDRRYTVADLEQLVRQTAAKGIRMQTDLGDYHREFLKRSKFLIHKNRLGEVEEKRWFVKGFDSELWGHMEQLLLAGDKDYTPDDTLDVDEVVSCAKRVLSGSRWGREEDRAASAGRQTSEWVVKVEEGGQAMAELLRAVQTLTTTMAAGGRPTFAPGPGPSALRPMGDVRIPGCTFCRDMGHMVRFCPVAEEYVRQGKCKRGVDGRLYMPNGDFLPPGPAGMSLKDRIDSAYPRAVGSATTASGSGVGRDAPPHLSANLFEVASETAMVEVLHAGEATIEEVEEEGVSEKELRWEIERMQVLLGEAERRKGKGQKSVRFDGVVIDSGKTAAGAASAGKGVTSVGAMRVMAQPATQPGPGIATADKAADPQY